MKRLKLKKKFNDIENVLKTLPTHYRVDDFVFEITDGNETFRIRWEGSATDGKAVVISETGPIENTGNENIQVGEIPDYTNNQPGEVDSNSLPEVNTAKTGIDLISKVAAEINKSTTDDKFESLSTASVAVNTTESDEIPNGTFDDNTIHDLENGANKQKEAKELEPPATIATEPVQKEAGFAAKNEDPAIRRFALLKKIIPESPPIGQESKHEPEFAVPTDNIVEEKIENTGLFSESVTSDDGGASSIAESIEINYDVENTGVDSAEGKNFFLKKSRIPLLIIGVIGISLFGIYLLFENEKSNAFSDNKVIQNDSLTTEPKLNSQLTTGIVDTGLNDSLVILGNPNEQSNQSQFNTKKKAEEIEPIINSSNTAKQDLNTAIANQNEAGNSNANSKSTGNFQYLSVKQITQDLDYKPMCEGVTYKEEFQKFVVLGGMPDKSYQEKLDQFRNITVRIQIRDVAENKNCTVEIFYKKVGNKFEFVTYAEK